MDPRFFRQYANLIEAAEQDKPQQLDEGAMDWIGGQVMNLVNKFLSSNPKAKQAFEKAQQHKDELVDIFTSSKNSQEIKAKVQALVKQDVQPGGIAEGFANNPGKTLGAGVAVIASTAYLLVDKLLGVAHQIMMIPVQNPEMVNSMLADERLPEVVKHYVIPLMCLIYALVMLFYISQSDDR
jgi:hypothetical protein